MTEITCFVDRNIQFYDNNYKILNESNINIEFINLNDNNLDFSKIEFLLIHSFLKDDILVKMLKCKYVGIRACNTDYINKNIAKDMGIEVVGLTHQYGVNSVAEHTIMLILALSKNIVCSNENVKAGRWRDYLGPNIELTGKKIAIIGYGKIGKRVAELSKVFGMEVLMVPKLNNLVENNDEIEDVLKAADIISIHIPSTSENFGYIDKKKIDSMKKGAILINTARGSVVDYVALEAALNDNKFGGVGLDVFPQEPIIKSEIFKHRNVICTPHIAYLTTESLSKMNEELISNLTNFEINLKT